MADSEKTNQTQRGQQLQTWVNAELGKLTGATAVHAPLQMVSGDASFRRYFRATVNGASYIAVDAPPEQENSERFVQVAKLLATTGVHVPEIYSKNLAEGFMLLQDFGDATCLPILRNSQVADDPETADRLYREIIDALVRIQSSPLTGQLEPYHRQALRQEMDLFADWFCARLLGIELSEQESALLASALEFLEDNALSQQTVVVHRDFHSRNLMLPEQGPRPGIIDFQDAVAGPYTYDLVSLLRDCYICWPAASVTRWAEYYLAQAREAGVAVPADNGQFFRDFDLMGLQRHLKVMGIFSRLAIRDNKSRYLADIPLVIHYFVEVSGSYPELREFREWFQTRLLPLAPTN